MGHCNCQEEGESNICYIKERRAFIKAEYECVKKSYVELDRTGQMTKLVRRLARKQKTTNQTVNRNLRNGNELK